MEAGIWICRRCAYRAIPGLPRPLLCPDDGLPLVAEELSHREAKDALLGTILAERYALLDLLGGNLPGRNYLAVDLRERRRVAVRVLQNEDLSSTVDPGRFTRMAESLARYRHPGLVRILGHGILAENGAYLVTELAGGPTLQMALREWGALGWPAALDLLRPCVAALIEPHERGLAYGTLNPSRLVLVQPERPITAWAGVQLPMGWETPTPARPVPEGARLQLLGLGFEQLFTASPGSLRNSNLRINLDAFNALYLSPEDIQQQPLGPTSDIYSLGCILHQLVQGQPAFLGNSPLNIVAAHLSGQYPADRLRERGLPELAEVLATACHLEPARRFAVARQFLTALEGVPRGLAAPSPLPPLSPTTLQGGPHGLPERSSATPPPVPPPAAAAAAAAAAARRPEPAPPLIRPVASASESEPTQPGITSPALPQTVRLLMPEPDPEEGASVPTLVLETAQLARALQEAREARPANDPMPRAPLPPRAGSSLIEAEPPHDTVALPVVPAGSAAAAPLPPAAGLAREHYPSLAELARGAARSPAAQEAPPAAEQRADLLAGVAPLPRSNLEPRSGAPSHEATVALPQVRDPRTDDPTGWPTVALTPAPPTTAPRPAVPAPPVGGAGAPPQPPRQAQLVDPPTEPLPVPHQLLAATQLLPSGTEQQATVMLPALQALPLTALDRPGPLLRPEDADPTLPATASRETIMLASLDPSLLKLQDEYQVRQDAAREEEEEVRRQVAEAERRAEAHRRKQQWLTRAIVITSLFVLVGGGGTWAYLALRPLKVPRQLLLDPELQEFMASVAKDSDQPIPKLRTPAEAREEATKLLAQLAEESWTAVREGEKNIELAHRKLQHGTAPPAAREAGQDLLTLAQSIRSLRDEVIQLKVKLPAANDEQLPGILANATRFRFSLIDLQAAQIAARDSLQELLPATSHAASGTASASRGSAGSGPTASGATGSVVATALPSPATTGQPVLSDEELLKQVLGEREQGIISVPGLECGCDPAKLSRSAAAGPVGEALTPCEIQACIKIPAGSQRYDDVAFDLSRYFYFRHRYPEQLAALQRATNYGKYSHNPAVLFQLIAVAAKLGNFAVAIEAKDRFMYVKELLPPDDRKKKVPEAYRLLGLAFEGRYYRQMEDNPDRANAALLHRAVDYLERYSDAAGRPPEAETKLAELRRLQAEIDDE